MRTVDEGLNLPVKKKDGLRVTPADQIGIITGALAGTANKTLLAGEEAPYRLCWSVSGRWQQRDLDDVRPTSGWRRSQGRRS